MNIQESVKFEKIFITVGRSVYALQFSFHVLQRTAKKGTKIYNARAELLFCSLNLLFGDVLLAVVVVVA